MIAALAIIAGVCMVLTVLHWIVSAIREGARASERERQLEALEAIRAKQAAEIMREKTVEETARDLDAGQF